MKLVTYATPDAAHETVGRGGVLLDAATVLDLETLGAWATREGADMPGAQQGVPLPATLLDLLRRGPEAMADARAALALAQRAQPDDLARTSGLTHSLGACALRSPIPDPPSIRDFYTFEAHVKAARARRGVGMIPEWYQVAVFYFSNTSEVYGTNEPIPYPRHSQEVDFELEMAAVIGREGHDISADDAPAFIAGYMVLNDWSARDRWRQEQPLNMGPAKGKDFATSLGPWLVTPDELADRRIGSGRDERYDLAMRGRINGQQLSSDNTRNMYYSFPQMIERASQDVRLRPGDVIGSGTCGTGCILELGTERHRWLAPHDEVEMEIERLGILRTVIAVSRED